MCWHTCGLHELNVDFVGLVRALTSSTGLFRPFCLIWMHKDAFAVILAHAWGRDSREIKIFNLYSCSSHVRPDRCLQATAEHFTAAVRQPNTWSRILFHKLNNSTIPQKCHTVACEDFNQTLHSYKKSLKLKLKSYCDNSPCNTFLCKPAWYKKCKSLMLLYSVWPSHLHHFCPSITSLHPSTLISEHKAGHSNNMCREHHIKKSCARGSLQHL